MFTSDRSPPAPRGPARRAARKLPHLVLATLVGLLACGRDERDPRLGRMGRVRFTGGGGCNDATSLAFGSTAHLQLKPVGGGRLPAGLTVRSTAPAVIAARAGTRTDRIVLQGLREGSADIQLLAGGTLHDALGFDVQPVASVALSDEVARHAFTGATYVLELGEVYGACGERCPLIGGGFLRWSSAPAGGLLPVADRDRAATFRAGTAAGAVELRGVYVPSGERLVVHRVTVVDAAKAGPLAATLAVLPPGRERDVVDPFPPPYRLRRGSLFMVKLSSRAPGARVTVWGADVTWTIGGSAGAARRWDHGGPDPPHGPIFEARAAGVATLTGTVARLSRTIRVTVTIE